MKLPKVEYIQLDKRDARLCLASVTTVLRELMPSSDEDLGPAMLKKREQLRQVETELKRSLGIIPSPIERNKNGTY